MILWFQWKRRFPISLKLTQHFWKKPSRSWIILKSLPQTAALLHTDKSSASLLSDTFRETIRCCLKPSPREPQSKIWLENTAKEKRHFPGASSNTSEFVIFSLELAPAHYQDEQFLNSKYEILSDVKWTFVPTNTVTVWFISCAASQSGLCVEKSSERQNRSSTEGSFLGLVWELFHIVLKLGDEKDSWAQRSLWSNESQRDLEATGFLQVFGCTQANAASAFCPYIVSKLSITHKELQRDYSPSESCIQILIELKSQTTKSLKSCFYFNTMQVQEPKFGFPVTESARLRHHAFTVMALGQLLHSVPIKYVLSGANSPGWLLCFGTNGLIWFR